LAQVAYVVVYNSYCCSATQDSGSLDPGCSVSRLACLYVQMTSILSWCHYNILHEGRHGHSTWGTQDSVGWWHHIGVTLAGQYGLGLGWAGGQVQLWFMARVWSSSTISGCLVILFSSSADPWRVVVVGQ